MLAAGTNLAEQNIDVDYEEDAKPNTFFRIRVSDLYTENEVKEEKRRKLVGAFADKNFANAIFAKYVEHIFTSRLTVRINGRAIDRKE